MAETSSSSSSSSHGGGTESSVPQPRDLKTDPKNMKEVLADLSSRFHDFDDPNTSRALVDEALDKNTANFAVRFGVDHSEIATNLHYDDMRTLLQTSADKKNESIVTWM